MSGYIDLYAALVSVANHFSGRENYIFSSDLSLLIMELNIPTLLFIIEKKKLTKKWIITSEN